MSYEFVSFWSWEDTELQRFFKVVDLGGLFDTSGAKFATWPQFHEAWGGAKEKKTIFAK